MPRVGLLLPERGNIVILTPAIFARAAMLKTLGFKPADAVHLAAAEDGAADVLVSCDDRFCRTAARHRKSLRVAVRNPLEWLKEMEHANDGG